MRLFVTGSRINCRWVLPLPEWESVYFLPLPYLLIHVCRSGRFIIGETDVSHIYILCSLYWRYPLSDVWEIYPWIVVLVMAFDCLLFCLSNLINGLSQYQWDNITVSSSEISIIQTSKSAGQVYSLFATILNGTKILLYAGFFGHLNFNFCHFYFLQQSLGWICFCFLLCYLCNSCCWPILGQLLFKVTVKVW